MPARAKNWGHVRSKMTGRCFLTPLPPAALLPHAGRAGDAEAVRLTCCIPQPQTPTGAKPDASAGSAGVLTRLDTDGNQTAHAVNPASRLATMTDT